MRLTTRVCFVIAPIGETGSTTRDWSDSLLRHVIRPALEPLGFVVVRADLISAPGPILMQIAELLVRADLVVADLTDRNPNVYYELGVRHALARPTVHVARAAEALPFDVAGMRTIFVDISRSHSFPDAVDQVKLAAETALREPSVTPISHAASLANSMHDTPTLFGSDLAAALAACVMPHDTLSRTKGNAMRASYDVELADGAIASFERLPESAGDVLMVLLNQLSRRKAVTETDAGVNVIQTSACEIGERVYPALRLYYAIKEDHVLVLRAEQAES